MSFMINPYWFSAVTPSSGFGFRYGYEFDGVDENLNFGNVLNNDGSSPFTISFWLKGVTSNDWIISKQTQRYEGLEIFSGGSRHLELSFGRASTDRISCRSTNTMSSYDWVFCTVSYDGSKSVSGVKMYFNGVEETIVNNRDTWTGSSLNSGDLRFGSNPWASSLRLIGRLDDVQYYSSVLSLSDINDIYNSGYITAPIASPIHHWKLGEEDTFSTNWTVKDSVGSLDGTSVNMEEEDRKLGVAYSMEFDGVDEAISFGDVLETDYNEPVSWAFWFKPISSGGDIIQKMSNADSYRGFNITMDGSKPQFRLINSVSSNWIRKRGNANLVVGNWFHMVCTYDGSGSNNGAKIYINGVEDSYGITTGTLTGTILNSNPLEFNRSTTYSFLTRSNINLMEVSQYTSELSASDVALLYNTTGTLNGVPIDPRDVGLSPSFYTPLVGPNDSFSTNWTITDEINGNNGTSVNMEEADKTSETP